MTSILTFSFLLTKLLPSLRIKVLHIISLILNIIALINLNSLHACRGSNYMRKKTGSTYLSLTFIPSLTFDSDGIIDIFRTCNYKSNSSSLTRSTYLNYVFLNIQQKVKQRTLPENNFILSMRQFSF